MRTVVSQGSRPPGKPFVIAKSAWTVRAVRLPLLGGRRSGDVPVAGCFCGGEFGPVGGKNFVHRFTASIALFYKDE